MMEKVPDPPPAGKVVSPQKLIATFSVKLTGSLESLLLSAPESHRVLHAPKAHIGQHNTNFPTDMPTLHGDHV